MGHKMTISSNILTIRILKLTINCILEENKKFYQGAEVRSSHNCSQPSCLWLGGNYGLVNNTLLTGYWTYFGSWWEEFIWCVNGPKSQLSHESIVIVILSRCKMCSEVHYNVTYTHQHIGHCKVRWTHL